MSEAINYLHEVPLGWEIVSINDTFSSISLNGIKIKQKSYLSTGKYAVVDQGQELIGGYYNDEKLVVNCDPPYVVFGDHTKAIKYITFKFIPGADGVKVLKPSNHINPKLFFYFLQCLKLPDKGYARHFQFINHAEFPLPPIAEQHRIVSKIEELFSDLDKGIETLNTAKDQLKIYRQAVLKYAFEGKLTNPDVIEGELPEGWVVRTFSNVSTKIGDIDHKMPAKVSDGKYPYLSTSNITRDNELDFKSAKLISEADYNRLSRKIIPEKGDIIFPRYGTIGRNVLVNTDREFLISYSCAIIKVNTEVMSPKYLYYFSLSALTRKEIEKHIVETTQANVGISSIKVFKINYPSSITEQEIIVQEVESRLSICDKIEESIEQGLQQAEALRQSILKKAFEGKLVPQDPNDEPAHVLLARIKAERAAVQPIKKQKKAKA